MATASLVHFGLDTCFRLPVLRKAGFEIVECDSLEELPLVLASHPDAVVMYEEREAAREQAIALTRSQSTAPVILFASEWYSPRSAVDLLIPALTTPERWLEEIRALIESTRAVDAQPQAIRERSAMLVRDSAAVREASPRKATANSAGTGEKRTQSHVDAEAVGRI